MRCWLNIRTVGYMTWNYCLKLYFCYKTLKLLSTNIIIKRVFPYYNILTYLMERLLTRWSEIEVSGALEALHWDWQWTTDKYQHKSERSCVTGLACRVNEWHKYLQMSWHRRQKRRLVNEQHKQLSVNHKETRIRSPPRPPRCSAPAGVPCRELIKAAAIDIGQ